ncbi:L-asparaginase precursor [Xylariaceae sp. FL0016]|nr:L-asparaginase precursor [Xylariaceae sp. FL0016]
MPPKIKPRIIIHGGAGNIRRDMDRETYTAYYTALMSIVTATDTYMRHPSSEKHPDTTTATNPSRPTALDTASHAVTLLESNPLFNSAHGAVFTRDGLVELEASVMVSRGHAKRGLGVTGLRRVKHPILLAKAMLQHGDRDLLGWRAGLEDGTSSTTEHDGALDVDLDVPSAQGHTLLHGETAEKLARQYRLEMVDPSYYFTQRRWDEHVRGLEQEKSGKGTAHWSAEEYLPQGTCGAVALDEDGVVCVATSTGGITNKLTGRIGDTPVVGAGFWAEEWSEKGHTGGASRPDPWQSLRECLDLPGPVVELSSSLRSFLADCLPTPFTYNPIPSRPSHVASHQGSHTTRSVAVSGTGNGDSFLRTSAARSMASIARWGRFSGASAVNQIVGRGGELQKSAGPRWGKTGEGEGGMIGIECIVTRDGSGSVSYVKSEILQDHNSEGMLRAWIQDDGKPAVKIWHGDQGRV